jgi:hypothetical protein
VLLLWEPRSYYCGPRCQPDILLDHWTYPLARGEPPSAVFDGWRKQGISHVLVFEAGFEFQQREAPNPTLEKFRPALEQAMTRQWTNNAGYSLYAWRD